VTGEVEAAVSKIVEDAPVLSLAHGGLAATAVVLARTLDEGAGLATAAVARELRATLEALTKDSRDDDGIGALINALSTPVGHAAD
jgi:hypothetical protein